MDRLARPGFRPGLWSAGPTARPGTGERPVGAPDHSQGRNPWAAKPLGGETLGGTDTAPPRRGECTYPAKFAGVRRRPRPNSPVSADTPRQMPRDLRRLRKRPGKRRETCAACANAAANAERPALPAQTPRQTPRDLRRLRKRHGKRRETRAACAHLLRIQNNL